MKKLIQCLALTCATGVWAAATSTPDPTLLAHWTFDEPAGDKWGDASGHGGEAALERPAAGVTRTRGIHGQALNLRGAHALRTRLRLPGPECSALSFSAWVRPTDLSGYREIFRQECPNRLLFSFQLDGTIVCQALDVKEDGSRRTAKNVRQTER